jgi:hypothetical protein
MEIVGIAATEKADIAKSTTSNVAMNVISALSAVVIGKGDDGLDERDRRIFNSMRNKLFLKYIGADYEVLLTGSQRNDQYRGALS